MHLYLALSLHIYTYIYMYLYVCMDNNRTATTIDSANNYNILSLYII